MIYPAKVSPAPGGGFVVTFRDIPEAITQGDDMSEAVEMARDALITAFDFYFERRQQVPVATKLKRGEHPVELPANVKDTGGHFSGKQQFLLRVLHLLLHGRRRKLNLQPITQSIEQRIEAVQTDFFQCIAIGDAESIFLLRNAELFLDFAD